MTAPPPFRRGSVVLPGGHSLLLALALLLAAPLPPPPARAQDGSGKGKDGAGKEGEKKEGKDKEKEKGKGKDGEKKEKDGKTKEEAAKEEAPKRKTEEEKLLESLGVSWKAGDAKALAARLPAKRKTTLRLPGAEEGDYRAEQAKSILAGYFKARSFSKVELKSVQEATGTFQVEYVLLEERRRVKAELLLALGTEEKERVLVSVRESP
jgi:hypothetical protein